MSIDRRMGKEDAVPIYNGINYSVIKRDEIESAVVRWMNPESVIQSKVNQKEKNKYYILMHIYGILKNGTNEHVCRAGIEIQM